MAARSYTAALRCGNEQVASLRMDPGCGDALVGRSHRCAIRTPDGDNSVSGVHARLFWKGSSLMIEDAGSRNGVYCHGSRLLKPAKVSSGDIYTIGGCSLQFSVVQAQGVSRKAAAQEFHRLERLNGDKAGQQIDIVTKAGAGPFTVGLDPANSLCLADMLVSRRHAEFSVRENGECWIRDLGSKNGTFVNGEPLKGKERLLKDGDKVTIAYFDFRFLDRSVQHKRLFLWIKAFAVAATLCVMAGAYVVWVTQGSSAEEYMAVTRQYAAAQDFDSAGKTLEAGRMARDADRYRAQMDALESQLERWRRTSADWDRAKRLLSDGRLGDARRALDPLVGGAADAWMWNGTDAVAEKRGAEFAQRALRRYFDAADVLAAAADGQPERQSERLGAVAEPLAGFLAESAAEIASAPYLAPLTNRIARTLSQIASIREGFARVDSAIAALDADSADFSKLAESLGTVAGDQGLHAAVRAYAEKYRVPCAGLAAAKDFVEGEFAAVSDMRFTDVARSADSLVLPDKELCSRHPQLSDHRVRLEGQHGEVQRLAANIQSMVRGLAEKGVTESGLEKHLVHVLSEESWRKALAFECFSGRPPLARRKDPAGQYDELLGVEYTFQSIRALPEDYNGFCLRMTGFSPDVVEARAAFEYADVFVKFVEERPKWLRRGRLGAFYDRCRRLVGERKRLTSFLSAFSGDRRAKLIASFYAGFFGAPGFDLARRRELAGDFRAIQREVADLCDRYSDASDPVEQIAIRDKILATGLPGDSQTSSKWVQKFEGGGR